jgi:hypothetical protein
VSSASSFRPTGFVAAVARDVKAHYASRGIEPRTEVHSRLAKIWWGEDRAIHYELAIHERMLQLEMGLHFEATAQRNHSLYEAFGSHLLEIQQELGESIWLEEWDRGWTRIYETEPLLPLDDERIMSVAARLCELIDCLQPVLESIEGNQVT